MLRPTRPPDDRRARHEAAGEWPGATLSALLDARARDAADRLYAVEGSRDGDRTHTFADLKRRADRMAVALRGLGVRPGDVVSYQLPNWFEAAALACAVDRVGAVQNPIITIYREREVGFACQQARSRVLVVPGVVRGTDHRELARTVQREARDLEHVLTLRAEPLPGQRALEPLEADPPTPLGPSPLGPHDVSFVLYTSGTTADPKGVLHTSSTLAGLNAAQRAVFGADLGDRTLLQFPLMHIGGIAMFVRAPLDRHGACTVFMDTFDPALAIDLIERWQLTSAGGPPAILQAMLAAPNFTPEKMRSVRVSGSGAADVSPDLIRTVAERFGCFAYRSYGMTECPMVTSARPDDPREACWETDGRPSPGCIVRVVDEAGRQVARGTEGELELYGPQLCVGYLDPALNAAFTADGFLRSGDLGVMDANGFVRITGRRKDVIIRKGENLSAKGIEDDLAAHPRVREVAVVGVPDRECGERVCACVVLADAGALTLGEVRDFMKARGVMMQKIPEQLVLLDELPRNATGKVRKDVLRARLREGA